MAMAGVTYCVHTEMHANHHKSAMPFDQKYFFDLVVKLNQFYKTCLLPQRVVSLPFSNKDIL